MNALFFLLVACAFANQEGLVSLTDETFKQYKEKPTAMLVKFFAPWCGHCKRLAPTYAELADAMKENEKIIIAEVNCEENKKTCQENEIRGYPTVKLFQGAETIKYDKQRTIEDFKAFIADHVKN